MSTCQPASTREIPDCYVKALVNCTQDCLDMWKKPPSMRRCAHGYWGVCLGMAGAQWPVLLQLQPAGAVGCGGVGTERNVLSRFLLHCISLVYPGTEHTT